MHVQNNVNFYVYIYEIYYILLKSRLALLRYSLYNTTKIESIH